MPEWMNYLAHRIVSSDRPDGQPVCFWYHGPTGSTCRDEKNCRMSHACPVFNKDGTICGKMHSAKDHNPPYGGRWPGH